MSTESSTEWSGLPTPVLVLGLGRSGSTLLMQLLGTASEIGFRREPPFEARHLSYLLRWAQLCGVEGATTPEWQREAEFRAAPELGGLTAAPSFPWPTRSDPSGAASAAAGPSLWVTAFFAAWRAFLARAEQVRDYAPGGGPVRFHGEKTSDWIADSLESLGAAPHRLTLLRDPRDVFLSIWAFNEKRGRLAFGVRDGETREAHAARFANDLRPWLRGLADADAGSRRLLVRYDDLVVDLAGVAERLSAQLGVSLDAERVLADRAKFAGHRTSEATTAPRWPSEMPAEQQRCFAERIGAELDALGYEV